MITLKHHHRHHIEMTPVARKVVSFIIALTLTAILFNIMAIGQARAEPTAFGQPLPAQCISHMEWVATDSYPVTVFEAPGCGRPWLENLVEFWRWFQSATPRPK